MDNLPVTPLGVQLLYRSAIRECLISHCVYVALGECATVGAPHGLGQLGQSLLPLGLYIEGFALAEVGPFQGTTNNIDIFLLLSNAKVDSVVHHFA